MPSWDRLLLILGGVTKEWNELLAVEADEVEDVVEEDEVELVVESVSESVSELLSVCVVVFE